MKEKCDLMATRIGLESFEVMGRHGAFDFEHEKKQPFIFSIWATLAEDVTEDNLERTLDYSKIQESVISNVVEIEPVKLMETLAARIINDLSSDHRITKIEIRIEKPDAVLPNPGGMPVVELSWTRC